MSRRVFVVGAGVAGLAAAVEAQRRGARVVLHEAAPHAGGRCRSFFDAKLGVTLDNGNHLLLSGNQSTMAYLRAIGATGTLIGPTQPEYPFFDVATGDAWTVRMSPGRLPRWIFDAETRVRRRLVELAETYEDGVVPLTQEDIAAMAGTSRATVNRVLREEQKLGAVALARGRTSVLDVAELRARCGYGRMT